MYGFVSKQIEHSIDKKIKVLKKSVSLTKFPKFQDLSYHFLVNFVALGET